MMYKVVLVGVYLARQRIPCSIGIWKQKLPALINASSYSIDKPQPLNEQQNDNSYSKPRSKWGSSNSSKTFGKSVNASYKQSSDSFRNDFVDSSNVIKRNSNKSNKSFYIRSNAAEASFNSKRHSADERTRFSKKSFDKFANNKNVKERRFDTNRSFRPDHPSRSSEHFLSSATNDDSYVTASYDGEDYKPEDFGVDTCKTSSLTEEENWPDSFGSLSGKLEQDFEHVR